MYSVLGSARRLTGGGGAAFSTEVVSKRSTVSCWCQSGWDGDWEGETVWVGTGRMTFTAAFTWLSGCARLPGRGIVKSREMRKNPKPENRHTCPQVCGWSVPVPWTCAAVLGSAGPSLFLMADRDALSKGENNRNQNLYMKTRRPSGSLSKQE